MSSCTALLLRSLDFAHVRLDLGNAGCDHSEYIREQSECNAQRYGTDSVNVATQPLPRHVRFRLWGKTQLETRKS